MYLPPMSRLRNSLCFLLFSVTTGFGQQMLNASYLTNVDMRQEQVPAEIRDKFNNERPGVPAVWRKDGDNYMVNFTDPDSNRGQIIVYDKNGAVLRRESELDNTAYPQSISEYYFRHYPGEKFRTWASEDQQGVKTFFIDRKSEIIRFDKDGKMIPGKTTTPANRPEQKPLAKERRE
jgi:hypothetical protein